MKINNLMAHFGQPKPKNMSKSLYDSGALGCAKSNLSSGCSNLQNAIQDWVSDEDTSNFDRVGHRRWVLNPTMKDTGLGFLNNFSAMYALDNDCPENKEKNVAWPCQNMPIEFFGDNYPWSLSVNKVLNKKVKVSITDKKTNKVTKFENISNDKFVVNNENYGQPGCIIFRPNFKYSDGDSFRVDVNCTDFSVSYDVNFFHIKCVHNKDILGIIKYKCSFCYQVFDEEIGIQPHDYTLKRIPNISKTEGTCKDCGKKIQFTPPTKFSLWFKRKEDKNYSDAILFCTPIGSEIIVWVEGVNGDSDYSEIIFEVSDPSLLKLPKKIGNNPNNCLKVIGSGNVEVTYYPKYNPNFKRSFRISLG